MRTSIDNTLRLYSDLLKISQEHLIYLHVHIRNHLHMRDPRQTREFEGNGIIFFFKLSLNISKILCQNFKPVGTKLRYEYF